MHISISGEHAQGSSGAAIKPQDSVRGSAADIEVAVGPESQPARLAQASASRSDEVAHELPVGSIKPEYGIGTPTGHVEIGSWPKNKCAGVGQPTSPDWHECAHGSAGAAVVAHDA